jgi:hypothetical protein
MQDEIPTKFIIRELPPSISEEDFHGMLSKVLRDDLEWFRYHPGKEKCANVLGWPSFSMLSHQ